MSSELPSGLEHVRTTEIFDNDSVPAGLLRAHRVADDVWGRLVVQRGIVTLVFEDDPSTRHEIGAGGSHAIPPARRHHVELGDDAEFAVEFHRAS